MCVYMLFSSVVVKTTTTETKKIEQGWAIAVLEGWCFVTLKGAFGSTHLNSVIR